MISFDRIPSSATTNLCLKCIERSTECLEGCRFARYCFTKSTHFVSSPLVACRQKMLYYVVNHPVVRFFGYYISEQYERLTVFGTSSRAQKTYSSARDSERLRVLEKVTSPMPSLLDPEPKWCLFFAQLSVLQPRTENQGLNQIKNFLWRNAPNSNRIYLTGKEFWG